MDKSIYIFGTDHKYQRPDTELTTDRDVSKFKSKITDICGENNIQLLAEENTLLAQKEYHLGNSVLYNLTIALGIKHIYCDPDRNERLALKIPQDNDIDASSMMSAEQKEKAKRESNEKRESEWLRRIDKSKRWPVLLVCGENHVVSFCHLAERVGVEQKIVERKWHS